MAMHLAKGDIPLEQVSVPEVDSAKALQKTVLVVSGVVLQIRVDEQPDSVREIALDQPKVPNKSIFNLVNRLHPSVVKIKRFEEPPLLVFLFVDPTQKIVVHEVLLLHHKAL